MLLARLVQRSFGNYKEMVVIRILELLPAERADHAGLNAIWGARMPMVVKAPDHEMVLLDERLLGSKYGVVLPGEVGGLIEVTVESRFMRNDQVVSRGGRALEHVISGHHGGGDASDRCIGIAGLEGIDGLTAPGDSHVLLNALDHLPGGQAIGLGYGGGMDCRSQQQGY